SISALRGDRLDRHARFCFPNPLTFRIDPKEEAMKLLLLPLFAAGTWFVANAGVFLSAETGPGPGPDPELRHPGSLQDSDVPQDPQYPRPPSADDIQKMMAKAKQF